MPKFVEKYLPFTNEEQWDNENIFEVLKSTTIVLLLEVTNHYE